MNPALNNPFNCIWSSINFSGATRQVFFVGDSDLGKLLSITSQYFSMTHLVSLQTVSPELSANSNGMTSNVVSSQVRPSLSCMTEIILNPLGWRRSVCTMVGVDLVITKHLAEDIMITWCLRINFILSTTSKSSIPTIKRLQDRSILPTITPFILLIRHG